MWPWARTLHLLAAASALAALAGCGSQRHQRPPAQRIVHLVVDEKLSVNGTVHGYSSNFRWPSASAGYAHVREWVDKSQREEDWISTDGHHVRWQKTSPSGAIVKTAMFTDRAATADDAVTALRRQIADGLLRRTATRGHVEVWKSRAPGPQVTWTIDARRRVPLRYVSVDHHAAGGGTVRYVVRFRVAEVLPQAESELNAR